jgi:hypothetical protein
VLNEVVGMSDVIPKYPKVKRLGDDENVGILEGEQIVVQEKLDGANFRFALEDHLDEEYQIEGRDLVFGSRNVLYKNEKDIDNAFEHAVEYVRDTIDVEELRDAERRADSPLVVYGEAMHPHTLDYKWDDVPSFLGFDIKAVGRDDFLPWGLAEIVFHDINLPTVPTLHNGPDELPNEIIDQDGLHVPQSEYREGLAEGIIIRNERTDQTAKHRSQEFKEKHGSQSVTDPDDYDPSDSVVLARQYTTEARVLKMIHKYEDRGRDVEMGMMEDLWRDVFDDIVTEEYDDIFLGNHVIDTKEFRSEVASITADVLQQYLSRPQGSVLNQTAEGETA